MRWVAAGAGVDFSKAIALDPRHGDAYVSRDTLKAAMGDRQGAIKDCDQAIAINQKRRQRLLELRRFSIDLGRQAAGLLGFQESIGTR